MEAGVERLLNLLASAEDEDSVKPETASASDSNTRSHFLSIEFWLESLTRCLSSRFIDLGTSYPKQK
jgi:hypothetical protein